MTGPPSPAGPRLAEVLEGPVPSSRLGAGLLELIRVMAHLRGPGGCPWDAEQTHGSLAPHLLEETHELLEAIEAGDDDSMREELGDVLLQVVFHAQLAADDRRWDVDDVADGLVGKLVHRHPHVFGEVEVTDAEEVRVNWERLKVAGTSTSGAVEDDIPASLPALARAAKVQRRAAGRGTEAPSVEEALATVRARVARLGDGTGADGSPADAEEAIGEMLFDLVALSRAANVDAETALRRAVRAFSARFEGSGDPAE